MADRSMVDRDPRAEKARDYRRQYGHRRWPRMADLKRRRAARLAARRRVD